MRQRRLGSEIWTKCLLAIKLHIFMSWKGKMTFQPLQIENSSWSVAWPNVLELHFSPSVNTLWGNSWQIFKAKLAMWYLCFSCLWIVWFYASFFFPVWVLLTYLKCMETTNTCRNIKHHATLFSTRNYAMGYFWYSCIFKKCFSFSSTKIYSM